MLKAGVMGKICVSYHYYVVSHCRTNLQKIDGHDSRILSLDHLRTQMALVGQEPRLFSGSIRENICFGLGEDVS